MNEGMKEQREKGGKEKERSIVERKGKKLAAVLGQ